MVSSALAIEAWALRIACGLAVEQNFPEVIYESDCKNLITYATDSKAQCPWEMATIVADIKKWAGTRRWSFVWCNRGLNKAAHWIASECIDKKILFHTGCIPPALESILRKDLS